MRRGGGSESQRWAKFNELSSMLTVLVHRISCI